MYVKDKTEQIVHLGETRTQSSGLGENWVGLVVNLIVPNWALTLQQSKTKTKLLFVFSLILVLTKCGPPRTAIRPVQSQVGWRPPRSEDKGVAIQRPFTGTIANGFSHFLGFSVT